MNVLAGRTLLCPSRSLAIATISVWNRSAVSTDQVLPAGRHGDASSLDEERVGNCAI